MRKLTLIIILFTSCLTAFGQMPLPKKPTTSKKNPLPKAYYFSDWSLGLSFKSSLENILPNVFSSDEFEFEYKPKFSYEFELFIERRLDDNWVWVSGINYHSVSIEYNHNFPIIFDKKNSSSIDGKFINQYDFTINNSFEHLKFIGTAEYTIMVDENDYQDGEQLNFRVSSVNTIKYLGIPLALKKEFGHRKLRFSLKAGIEAAMMIKSKIDYNKYHQSGFHVEGRRPDYKSNRIGSIPIQRAKLSDLEIISQSNNLQKLQINGLVNVGLLHTYKYNTFFLEAEFKRGMSRLAQKDTHTSYLFNYGLRTGFIKRFKESKIYNMPTPKQKFKW
ncbi:MAG: hypothetical protein AB8F94_04935 [Saprospiraceae bacterium]